MGGIGAAGIDFKAHPRPLQPLAHGVHARHIAPAQMPVVGIVERQVDAGEPEFLRQVDEGKGIESRLVAEVVQQAEGVQRKVDLHRVNASSRASSAAVASP